MIARSVPRRRRGRLVDARTREVRARRRSSGAIDVAAPGAVGINASPGPLGHDDGLEVGDQGHAGCADRSSRRARAASDAGARRRAAGQGSRTIVLGEHGGVGVTDGVDQQIEQAPASGRAGRRQPPAPAPNVGGLEAGQRARPAGPASASRVADDAKRHGASVGSGGATGRSAAHDDDHLLAERREREDGMVEEWSDHAARHAVCRPRRSVTIGRRRARCRPGSSVRTWSGPIARPWLRRQARRGAGRWTRA